MPLGVCCEPGARALVVVLVRRRGGQPGRRCLWILHTGYESNTRLSPRTTATPTACVFCSRRAVTRTRHTRVVRRPRPSPREWATPTACAFWRRLAATFARLFVDVRAIGMPAARFDLLMLSKQLPYVLPRALNGPASSRLAFSLVPATQHRLREREGRAAARRVSPRRRRHQRSQPLRSRAWQRLGFIIRV